MNKEEWKTLIKSICEQKILPKLHRLHRRFHPFEFYERFAFRDNGIYRAARTIRFIEDNFDDDDDLLDVFNNEHLDNTLNNLANGLEHSNHFVLKTGVANVIEEFYEEIVDGMEITDIPESDFTALREAGSQDPKSELLVSMVRIKKRKVTIHYNSNERTFQFYLKESEKVVHKRKKVLAECNSDNPPTKKKIFKGLGGISRGAILTGVDIGLLMGLWPVPLSPDTTTVGAVASITTGIGDIMIAIGDLRGE